jgi:hypothetical protein
MAAESAARTTNTKTRAILLLGFNGCAALDLTGPHEVFALSTHLTEGRSVPPYRVELLAERSGPFCQRWAWIRLPMLHGGLSMVRRTLCSWRADPT